MDWFSWLSKTGLDPSVVYEYSLSFAHNELEEEDVVYFDHEFLQSMGISIAKHRLEIIKLSNTDSKTTTSRPPMKKLFAVAVKRTKRCLEKCLRTLAARLGSPDHGSSALVLVQTQTQRQRQRLIPKRDKKLVVAKQGRLMLTNGSPMVVSSGRSRVNSFSSPSDYNHKSVDDDDDQEDGYWSNGVEVIRWDTLFQDLKPT